MAEFLPEFLAAWWTESLTILVKFIKGIHLETPYDRFLRIHTLCTLLLLVTLMLLHWKIKVNKAPVKRAFDCEQNDQNDPDIKPEPLLTEATDYALEKMKGRRENKLVGTKFEGLKVKTTKTSKGTKRNQAIQTRYPLKKIDLKFPIIWKGLTKINT